MRLNKYIAQATGMSRRAADAVISEQRVRINESFAALGQEVDTNDHVTLDGTVLTLPSHHMTIMLNKPVGYVCSRDGQGSSTIYDLLPKRYHHLKPIGRLDKDSSGLLLLTDDGDLAQNLTHPSFQKEKIYEVELSKPLLIDDKTKIEQGVKLDDGLSQLSLKSLGKTGKTWQITMQEGRNRQIRRTFNALGHTVRRLHRVQFGHYTLADLKSGATRQVSIEP